ncbi:MAG TPA: hypothetical protein VMH33_14365 [Solirubrobacterales bacterium]|nr:hypothetical protein [Solirubrobacterales bacterium]
MAWRTRATPNVLFALAAALAAILLIVLSWNLTFYQDVWAVLLERQPWNAHSLLMPHNEHLIVFQVIVEKGLVAIFGMGDNRPEMLFMTATLLVAAGLFYVYLRRRVGGWAALLATLILLFFGEAWQILLWPFEMEFAAPFAAGMGMLLALEREDERGDLLAAVLLIVSIGFGSLGLSFLFAAFADIVVARKTRGLRRLWIVVIPAVLYVAWYGKYGHTAEHHLTFRNILNSPRYVFEGVGAGFASVLGLSNPPLTGEAGTSAWGPALAVAAIGLAIWGQLRRPGLSRTFWPIAAAALSFWLLAAFNFIPGREATSIRYVYADGAFVLLLAAELFSTQGIRLGKRALWVGAVVVFLALGPNLAKLGEGHEFLKEQTELTRADTGAMNIARRTMTPSFRLSPEIAGTPSLINVEAGLYEEAVGAHGSPGYSPAELATAGQPGRHWADVVLSQALPLSTVSEPGAFDSAAAGGSNCTAVPPDGSVPEVAVKPGKTRIEVGPGGEAELSMRRFTEGEYPVNLAGAPGGSVTTLTVPADEAPEYPWYLHVAATQEAWVCTG